MPRVLSDSGGHQGEYAEQRSNVLGKGLDVDPVSGESIGLDCWERRRMSWPMKRWQKQRQPVVVDALESKPQNAPPLH